MGDERAYIDEFSIFVAERERTFSEKINFLLDKQLHCFTLMPEVDPLDYFELISRLSTICSSTALSFSMHLYTQWGFQKVISPEKFLSFLGNEKNKLFGSLNEAGVYFMREDQLLPNHYSVTARKIRSGYLVNGVKKFVSLEPFVHFLPVYCLVENPAKQESRVAVLLIRKNEVGISVEADWDTISMSDSYSNSVRFNDVYVPHSEVLITEKNALQKTNLFAYLFRLSIASVYFGLAQRAYQYVLDYCKEKQVPHTLHTLAFFPGVQFSIAEMSILLEVSRSQITKFSEQLRLYLQGKPASDSINLVSLITKEIITKNAQKVINLAMKIVGISSINSTNILAKLYQDVKAGEFHPPQTDITYEIIAKSELGLLTYRNRWL
ncbi:putative acyl-CoA dehydrogenase YdbM [compost metagenome]